MLTPEDNERFEIHLIECDHCYQEYEEFGKITKLLKTEKKIELTVNEIVEDVPAKESLCSKILRYLWPETNLFLKPAIGYLAIILLIYPAYLGLKGTDSNNIRPVQMLHLIPERSTTQSAMVGEDILLIFAYKDSQPGSSYRITIKSIEGVLIFQDNDYNRFDKFKAGRLLLPAKKMKPGSYTLVIEDTQTAQPYKRQEYAFEIEE